MQDERHDPSRRHKIQTNALDDPEIDGGEPLDECDMTQGAEKGEAEAKGPIQSWQPLRFAFRT